MSGHTAGGFTPGPWRWDGNWLWDGDRMILFYTTDDDGVHLSCEADRPLIAAAPDLLKALQAELDDLNADIRWAEGSDMARYIARRERMETAIASATQGVGV